MKISWVPGAGYEAGDRVNQRPVQKTNLLAFIASALELLTFSMMVEIDTLPFPNFLVTFIVNISFTNKIIYRQLLLFAID